MRESPRGVGRAYADDCWNTILALGRRIKHSDGFIVLKLIHVDVIEGTFQFEKPSEGNGGRLNVHIRHASSQGAVL